MNLDERRFSRYAWLYRINCTGWTVGITRSSARPRPVAHRLEVKSGRGSSSVSVTIDWPPVQRAEDGYGRDPTAAVTAISHPAASCTFPISRYLQAQVGSHTQQAPPVLLARPRPQLTAAYTRHPPCIAALKTLQLPDVFLAVSGQYASQGQRVSSRILHHCVDASSITRLSRHAAVPGPKAGISLAPWPASQQSGAAGVLRRSTKSSQEHAQVLSRHHRGKSRRSDQVKVEGGCGC